MEYTNKPVHRDISDARSKNFVSWISTLPHELNSVSTHAKLSCYHSGIIKKVTSNVKFCTNLAVNTKRKVFYSPIFPINSRIFLPIGLWLVLSLSWLEGDYCLRYPS